MAEHQAVEVSALKTHFKDKKIANVGKQGFSDMDIICLLRKRPVPPIELEMIRTYDDSIKSLGKPFNDHGEIERIGDYGYGKMVSINTRGSHITAFTDAAEQFKVGEKVDYIGYWSSFTANGSRTEVSALAATVVMPEGTIARLVKAYKLLISQESSRRESSP